MQEKSNNVKHRNSRNKSPDLLICYRGKNRHSWDVRVPVYVEPEKRSQEPDTEARREAAAILQAINENLCDCCGNALSLRHVRKRKVTTVAKAGNREEMRLCDGCTLKLTTELLFLRGGMSPSCLPFGIVAKIQRKTGVK